MQKLIRILFVSFLFAFLFIKDVKILAVIIPILWAVSYKDFVKLNIKVFKSICLFNLGISLGYVVLGLIKGVPFVPFLVYINLKVYLLSYFVFLFFSKVDMVQFFSFSKELSYLLSISLSQIISYKKTYEDFKLAFKARVVKKLRDRQKGFITTVFGFFFQKAMFDAKERTLGMKARGFF